jgi:hypothetical protein
MFWGPKAQAFAAARTVDTRVLSDPLQDYPHPSYPPLVTSLYALGTIAASRFPWGAATLTSRCCWPSCRWACRVSSAARRHDDWPGRSRLSSSPHSASAAARSMSRATASRSCGSSSRWRLRCSSVPTPFGWRGNFLVRVRRDSPDLLQLPVVRPPFRRPLGPPVSRLFGDRERSLVCRVGASVSPASRRPDRRASDDRRTLRANREWRGQSFKIA